MASADPVIHDGVKCAVCDELVPRGHTVMRDGIGRMCWFCHTDENVDPDRDWDDDDDDFEDWDDWDD